jgi:arylsulfatase A-like enzyme
MFSMPGTLKPSSRKELVSSIDIFPTILDAVNMEVPQNLPGLNLLNKMEHVTNTIKLQTNIL